MLSPQRDQTSTREALVELERFRRGYPNSKYMPEVEKLYRETRDRLSESEFRVGLFHYRTRMYAGAISRLTTLLTDDPGYTRKDEVYYILGETYCKVTLLDQAVPFYEKLLAEYPDSKHALEAPRSGSPSSSADSVPRCAPVRRHGTGTGPAGRRVARRG